MNDESTQETLKKLNESLQQIQAAIRTSAAAISGNLSISTYAQDTSYLVVRALAETNVEFRTILLRLAQEPAPNPAVQESRDLLINALATHQRLAGERPVLKPVPPTGPKT